jgi:hypothetical protein
VAGLVLGGSSILALAAGPALAESGPNIARPSVSGAPQLGHALTEVPGQWSAAAGQITVHWEDCLKGARFVCTAIPHSPTTQGSRYTPTSSDLGKWITVVETAAQAPGRQGLAAAAPVGPVSVGSVDVTMGWTFFYTPTYTKVLGLAVHGLTRGMTIAVTCRGTGCPPLRRMSTMSAGQVCRDKSTRTCSARGVVDLTPLFRGQLLAVGARITVVITGPSEIRKKYRFTVRARHAPSIAISYA